VTKDIFKRATLTDDGKKNRPRGRFGASGGERGGGQKYAALAVAGRTETNELLLFQSPETWGSKVQAWTEGWGEGEGWRTALKRLEPESPRVKEACGIPSSRERRAKVYSISS